MPPEIPSAGARRSKKAWIFAAALAFTTICVVMVITAWVTILTPKAYQAGARMTLTVGRQPHIWGSQGDDRHLQMPIIHGVESSETLDKAISQLDLQTKWSKRFVDGDTLPLALIRKYLKASSSVVFEKNSDVFEVRVSSESRSEAADLANALAESLVVPDNVGTTTLIEPAEIPFSPIRPSLPLNLMIGLAFGLVLGGLLGGIVVWISKRPNTRPKVSRVS